MKKDLGDLSAEVAGIAMIIVGLGNQLDNNKTDTLRPCVMREALLGVQTHLERIADDLESVQAGGQG